MDKNSRIKNIIKKVKIEKYIDIEDRDFIRTLPNDKLIEIINLLMTNKSFIDQYHYEINNLKKK
jgi:hypothetical protein